MKTTSYLPLLALSAFAAAQAVTNSTDTSSKSVIFTDLDSVVSLFNPECSRPCIRDSFLGYFGTDKYFVDPKCVITGVKGEKFDGFTTCLCNGSPAVKNTTEAVTLAKEVDDKYTACLEKVQSDGACDVSSLASEDFDAATRGRIEQSCKATLEAAGKETDSKDTPKNDPKNKDDNPTTTTGGDVGTKSNAPKSNPSGTDAPSLAGSGAKILLGGTVSLATFAFAAFIGATNFLI